MNAQPVATEKDLGAEIAEIRQRYPKIKEPEAFVAWFLKAFVVESEEEAIKALVGGSGDKGLDAVHVDDGAKIVTIVQGKYRQAIGKGHEKHADVTSFAAIAGVFDDPKVLESLSERMDPVTADRLRQAVKLVTGRGYRVHMHYVTSGGCSSSLRKEGEMVATRSPHVLVFDVIDGKRVIRLLNDYLDGVAPPIPMLELEVESGNGVKLGGVLNRYDGRTGIESWVLPVGVGEIARMYDQAGIRLFARNVRGFLGETAINKNMEQTLQREPEYFWYYNNGVTVICDEAELTKRQGRDMLRLVNPQVINGQQTTRTLHAHAAGNSKATVLVRVISVPRETTSDTRKFDQLVSKIVAATNWQNAIKASDLMSNDRRQIELERNLRKQGYLYLRKRQTKREARRSAGSTHHHILKKEELAQVMAATILDPAEVRQGRERLFEERFYGQIFPNGDPSDYLPRFWMTRHVTRAAKGKPQRAYAKWLVCHMLWGEIEGVIPSRNAKQVFWQGSEQGWWPALLKSADAWFRVALRFYNATKGRGESAADVSSFFRRRDLPKELQKFLAGPGHSHRQQLEKAADRFRIEFEEWMAS